MGKLRSDSWAAGLSEEEAEQIEALFERHKVEVAIPILKAEFGREPSKTAIYNWLAMRRTQRVTQAAEHAVNGMMMTIAQQAPELSPDKLKSIGHQFFQQQCIAAADPLAWARIQRTEIQQQRLEIERERTKLEARRIAVLEKKAKQADEATKVASDANLTEAQKAAKFKSIFGMG